MMEIPHVDYPIEIMFVDEWEKWNTENIDTKVSGIFRTLLVGLKFILKYNKKEIIKKKIIERNLCIINSQAQPMSILGY